MAKFNQKIMVVPQIIKFLSAVFPEFSASKTYEVGNYVIYNDMLDVGTYSNCNVFRCKVPGAAAWNISNWDPVVDGITLAEAIGQGGLSSSIIAPEFSAASAYDLGDYVTHDQKMYYCVNPKAAGTAWNPADWNETTVGDEFERLNKIELDLAPKYVASQTYGTGDLVTKDGGLYKANEDGVTGAWDPTKWTATTISAELSSAGADFTLIAANYAETGVSYKTGDYVLYNNKVYKATADHPSPAGTWTGTGWAMVKVMDEVKNAAAGIVADEYDTAVTYNAGDMCIHEGHVYICGEDGTTGAWNSAKWTMTTIADELAEKGDERATAQLYDAGAGTYAVGDVVMHDAALYACKTAVTTPGAWDPSKWVAININDRLDAFIKALSDILGMTVSGGVNAANKYVFDIALKS